MIGQAFVHSLADATALLGPLPEPWVAQVLSDGTGILRCMSFLNTMTGETTQDDPRLQPLDGWESASEGWEYWDPDICRKFKNLATGEVVNFDPRLLPEALVQRGVAFQTFSLV